MTTITMDFPESSFSSTRFSPDEFAKEMRLTTAVAWYEQGRISQEMAAKIAGQNRIDFLLSLARMGKDSFQVDFDDLDRELSRD